MKRFSCCNIRSCGFAIAGWDILVNLCILGFASYYIYVDFQQMADWPQEEVKILSPLNNFISTMVDYVLVHNFSNAFYMVIYITLLVKSLINLVVASIMINGIVKQKHNAIVPWLLNALVSMITEIIIFVFMEIKIDEFDASLERRIVRSVLFSVFIVLNTLFAFGIYALYKVIKLTTQENRTLQESIVETSGLFQHVKV